MAVPKNIFDLFRLDDLKKRLIFFISKYHNDEYAIDPTTFLPNYKTLHEHIKRIWYIALIWYIATKLQLNHIHSLRMIQLIMVINFQTITQSLEMNWFHGDQVPERLKEIIDENKFPDNDIEIDENNEDDDNDMIDEK